MSLQTCESREKNLAEQQNLCLMKRLETGSRKEKKLKKYIKVQTEYDLDVYENIDK